MMTQVTHAKQTALYENHVRRSARMVDFSGWDMPLQYGKVVEEHLAVRQAAGLFDISHMGLVSLSSLSPEAIIQYLDGLVPQDLSKLYPGKAVYTQFLNEDGGIIDDIIVYQLPENRGAFAAFGPTMVICNAGNTQTDLAWMQEHASPGLKVEHHSDHSLFALQGPKFEAILTQAGYNAADLPKRFHVREAALFGIPVLVARTGYTGEDGVEIVVSSTQAEALWERLLETGAPNGLLPIGLAARDTLRLEAAYPLHGHDISEEDTPLEAGLGWSVKLNKASDFIGRQTLLAQQKEGLPREFYCLKLTQKSIARQHDLIFKNGEPIGEVTSGSISPLLNEPIAMGYIQRGGITGVGDTVEIQVRGKTVGAVVVERPFYKR